MNSGSNLMVTRKSISWLLVATIMLVAILPVHYHLHHLHDAALSSADAAHAHVIDLHVMAESAGRSHHDEAASIDASPDCLMIKNNPDLFLFILLAIILMLLPVFNKKINIQLNSRSTKLKQRYLYFAPLLRAPPLY